VKNATCFDCRFFVPDDCEPNDLTEELRDQGVDGECHRQPPALGRPLIDKHGAQERRLGEWPAMVSVHWCGKFQQRCMSQRQSATRDSSDSVSD